MLQRDYIQRLIREFMAALERMLEKKEVEVRREKIKELYNQYVGPYAFYSIATSEDKRVRNAENHPEDLYGRIVDRFVKNVKKLVG